MKSISKYILGAVLIVSGIVLLDFFISERYTEIHNTGKTFTQRIEYFEFKTGDTVMEGKIFLPDNFKKNKKLPAIYLVDFSEQHFKLATDEFEKVIDGTTKIKGLNVLVVSLADIPEIDAVPETFKEQYKIYTDLMKFVSAEYSGSSSNTFIGRGSEAGIVIMALFKDNQGTSVFNNFIVTDPSPKYTSAVIELIENNNFPQNKTGKKLHLSFSTSNNRALCTKLINLIEQANYPWLQFEAIEYTDNNYENTYPISYADGIEFIFNY